MPEAYFAVAHCTWARNVAGGVGLQVFALPLRGVHLMIGVIASLFCFGLFLGSRDAAVNQVHIRKRE